MRWCRVKGSQQFEDRNNNWVMTLVYELILYSVGMEQMREGNDNKLQQWAVEGLNEMQCKRARDIFQEKFQWLRWLTVPDCTPEIEKKLCFNFSRLCSTQFFINRILFYNFEYNTLNLFNNPIKYQSNQLILELFFMIVAFILNSLFTWYILM